MPPETTPNVPYAVPIKISSWIKTTLNWLLIVVPIIALLFIFVVNLPPYFLKKTHFSESVETTAKKVKQEFKINKSDRRSEPPVVVTSDTTNKELQIPSVKFIFLDGKDKYPPYSIEMLNGNVVLRNSEMTITLNCKSSGLCFGKWKLINNPVHGDMIATIYTNGTGYGEFIGGKKFNIVNVN